MGYCLFCFNFYSILKKIEINFQLNYYCIKQVKMAEITDYGLLEPELIAMVFGNEMIYNDLIKYTQGLEVHVVVYRKKNEEKTRQHFEVYFDDKKVIDEYYGLHHSCDMFYHLNHLETEMEEEEE